MKITAIPQFTRNAKRFTEIVTILVKYGLANWIKESDPGFIKGLFKSTEGVRLAEMSFEARFRMALTELGTAFVKLGQLLSTRADLIGPELARELAKLQADTPADPPEVVRATLVSQLGASALDKFVEFDDQALASASIGQVHRAVLPTGRTVVVKIQHRGIEAQIVTDLDILEALAELAEKYDQTIRLYQPRALVAEFRRNLLRELDFAREARNMAQFAHNFADDKKVHIPATYPELSARRVLTMEKLEGISIAHLQPTDSDPIDTRAFANRGANLFLEMIFRDRFYHADPHPGNIWALEKGVIGLLDCGMVGRLDEQTRYVMEDMLLAVVEKDADKLTEAVVRIGSLPADLNRRALQADLEDFVDEYVGMSIKNFDLTGTLTSMTSIIRRYHILLPPGIALLIRVLVILEGTSRLLNPDFSLAELLQPYYARAAQNRLSPDKLMQRLKRSYRDWDRLLDMLPRELSDILQRARQGQFGVRLEHHRLDAVVNRLVYGILTAALFLGSCQLLSRQIPPLIGGVSIFGLSGCVLAILQGVRLIHAIKKSGDLRKR